MKQRNKSVISWALMVLGVVTTLRGNGDTYDVCLINPHQHDIPKDKDNSWANASTQFAYGVLSGIFATAIIDKGRSIAPSLDKLDLHGNYGICRDNATGQLTTGVSLLAAYQYSQSDDFSPKTLLALRALGTLSGSMFAKMALKYLGL